MRMIRLSLSLFHSKWLFLASSISFTRDDESRPQRMETVHRFVSLRVPACNTCVKCVNKCRITFISERTNELPLPGPWTCPQFFSWDERKMFVHLTFFSPRCQSSCVRLLTNGLTCTPSELQRHPPCLRPTFSYTLSDSCACACTYWRKKKQWKMCFRIEQQQSRQQIFFLYFYLLSILMFFFLLQSSYQVCACLCVYMRPNCGLSTCFFSECMSERKHVFSFLLSIFYMKKRNKTKNDNCTWRDEEIKYIPCSQ